MTTKQKVLKELVKLRFKMISKFSNKRAAKLAFDLFCTPAPTQHIPQPPILEKSERFTFESEGNTIHGYRWNSGSPIKILIVHGFSSSIKKFAHLIEPLVARGYEVTGLDAPAHGSSTGKRITALSYAACLKNYFALHGPVNGIIAHSLGGLATVLALKGGIQNGSIKTVLFAPATESITQLDLFVQYFGLSKEVRAEMLTLIKNIAQTDLSDVSITKHIGQLKGEIYWFHDQEDPITPFGEAEQVATNGYSNIHFFPSKGYGHSGLYKEENNCKKVLDFLNF